MGGKENYNPSYGQKKKKIKSLDYHVKATYYDITEKFVRSICITLSIPDNFVAIPHTLHIPKPSIVHNTILALHLFSDCITL